MLARNYKGEVNYAATKIEKIKSSPTLAEALGLRWCLQWANEKNFSSLVIETDAELIVKCLYGKLNLALIEAVILDCQEILSQMQNTTVVSIRRDGNLAAHALVGVAKKLGSRTWVGNALDPILPIVCNDSCFV